ncbi:hypothetical protein COX27_00265 [Candidatus Kuenenbacteria bacterium CG23_combo_of_CG06-09_8_20_14_all_36_9]|uniref:PDZ domain-containing protein n=1 Tax=Candidatus Kuenenbacteria bacterium CG10_big_fil_rev_8_21_14_0_10_36_11 TaxID=1974618 RepID=A0A2M6WB08_9BACT|nr:MAG: hypothetical protein COX27_00265 [Candidatus Kuenenbacteria bacterium CG23_combo_of_CG06-09_8_20_14_all_36_9]PIT89977.1 MAG: hypothetical protein COU23_01015 [Candidatus Kuenenbacteria bacterium CG10_big_fil_rev_8_21_14_0_10_36_11]
MSKKFFLNKKIKSVTDEKMSGAIASPLGNLSDLQKFYQEKKFEKPRFRYGRFVIINLILIIVLSVIISFIIIFLFSSGFFAQTKLLSWLRIDSFLPAENVVVERKEQTNVLMDERVNEVVSHVLPSVVSIFSSAKSNAPNLVINQAKNYLGNGVVLTNDGWLVYGGLLKTADNYVAMQDNGNSFKVVNMMQDLSLGLSFLKVEADNLPVLPMIKRKNINPAESALIIDGLAGLNRSLFLTMISDNRFALADSYSWESEKNYLFLTLEKSVADNFSQAPVFNLNKELMGLIIRNQNFSYLMPTDYLKKSFTQLLTLKTAKPTYLGLTYTDLAINFVENQPRKGALIVAVKSDSPLKKLNVAAGDLVIKINDDLLDEDNNLSDLIQEYRPGDKIKLTLVNKIDQKEREITVVLE